MHLLILFFVAMIQPATYTISGQITWEHNAAGVKDATVKLTGTESQTTTADAGGYYSFTVSSTGAYTVTPTKDINKLNGLSSADATAIQQHVTLIAPINDPYKRIAADMNKDNKISTLDASIINQAVIGNPAANRFLSPSWVFVDAAYTLTLPAQNADVPTGYPVAISFTLSGNTSGLNFVGIKRGDVNGSADPQL